MKMQIMEMMEEEMERMMKKGNPVHQVLFKVSWLHLPFFFFLIFFLLLIHFFFWGVLLSALDPSTFFPFFFFGVTLYPNHFFFLFTPSNFVSFSLALPSTLILFFFFGFWSLPFSTFFFCVALCSILEFNPLKIFFLHHPPL